MINDIRLICIYSSLSGPADILQCVWYVCCMYIFVAIQPITQGVMARFNKAHGRSEKSVTDVEVYCPPEVKQVKGPLFGDLDGIQARYDAWMSLNCTRVVVLL